MDRNVYKHHPVLAHHCVLGAAKMFLELGSQMEKTCASGWIIPRASSVPDLDAVHVEIWDCLVDAVMG